MDSFEMSKIAGAVLAALLVIFVPRSIIEVRKQTHGEGKTGYALPAPEGAEQAKAPEGAAAEAAASAGSTAGQSIVPLLASADVEAGKAAFGKCAACHSANQGGPHGLGPNLWGIVGRKVGATEGFAYSAALKKKSEEGMVWDFDSLAHWVAADDKVIPGNKMIFPGIGDPATQVNLVAYLRSQSDSPAALPK